MRPECYFCHIKTVQYLVDKYFPHHVTAEDFIFSVHEVLGSRHVVNNPKLATVIHRIAKQKLNIQDLYADEKSHANELMLGDYDYWRNYIDRSSNRLFTAIKLAVIGNVIDYGAHSVKNDIKSQLLSLINTPLVIDQTAKLESAIKKANSILYLGDNAGEIVFDRLLIETMQHPNLTFATRGAPIINDVTLEDAKHVGIDAICTVIDNGFDAPSSLLETCSDKFMHAYNSADLILSKGQGNFEGLLNTNHPNTFFLLMAKCQPIAALLGCSKNDLIVTQLKDTAHAL